MNKYCVSLILAPVLLLVQMELVCAGEKYRPFNSQAKGQEPPAPRESLARISVPEGFEVRLFAAEPHVRQPIDMTFDARGRLWVAESYTYDGSEWTEGRDDRILIFEDSDNDGEFDKRKVFRGGFNRLTSLEIGFGGVWVLADTQLQFIADADSDDVPDGNATALLDGWSTKAHHNTVNGLTWGPDGWLYGRHGMKASSRVGKPGAQEEERIELDCSIWRFHPVRRVFQVVARGMVNPWGLDYDEFGQMFVTNNVNGHLWHLMHGSLFKRTAGKGYAPYSYERMPPCSDHLHFAGKNWQQGWTKSRGGKGEHGRLGGGHSHCGGMIYLGDNWPQRYRNAIFMCNTHGNRVNNDRIEWVETPKTAGYVGRHAPDFLLGNDSWFRGVTILYGPDGSVFLSDWSDLGECHDRDGVHRSSGRIYKIRYGKPSKLPSFDLARQSSEKLVQLQLHSNDWYVRQARKLLQARAAEGRDVSKSVHSLRQTFELQTEVARKLRILWCLHALGAAPVKWLEKLADSKETHLRVWAVRLMGETEPTSMIVSKVLAKRALLDQSQLVLLQVASSLQGLALDKRLPVLMNLVGRLEDERHRNLSLLTWYGLEPLVAARPRLATEFLSKTTSPLLRRFIVRRLSEAN